MFDKYVSVQLVFNRDGKRKGFDGRPIRKQHSNPIFNTREYVVEFADGAAQNFTANVIAKNMISQVDSDGHDYLLLHEITDHRTDATAVKTADGFILTKTGQRRPKIMTVGWELCVKWKEGSTDWIKLKDLKESYPVQVAECAVANKLVEEPTFKWWVPDVLQKRNRIIAKVKSRYWKTTHKNGIRLPHSAEEALQLDKESGTDHWQRALAREMNNVQVAWKVCEDVTPQDIIDGKVPDMIGYKQIKCHMIFAMKINLTRKARFVAGGHMTDAPQSITYSSVVTRDSVRLAFLIAALNDLDILACDITNAYLNAPCREKIWFVGGIEMGKDCGKVLILTRALYGLKSSGAAWRAKLAETLSSLGFKSSRADPDVWLREQKYINRRETYYEIILVYVDDVLAILETPQSILDDLSKFYVLKEGSVGPPTCYLGADISKTDKFVGRCLQTRTSRQQSRSSRIY